jgi:ATP-dependent DNA helicase PIF1
MRNHSRLNAYVRLLPLAWRANTDVQVCTSTAGVVQYMGVYAAKGETQSQSYKEIALQVLPYVKPNRSLLSFASRIINKLIGERDYSAQEVMHTLFGLPLVHCSRTVLNVDCRPEDAQTTSYTFRRGGDPNLDTTTNDTAAITEGTSLYAKYKDRPTSLEDVCYLDFLLHFTHHGRHFKRRPRAKPRVLNFLPQYSIVAQPEEFARVKLMLHHPFRNIRDVQILHGRVFTSYTSAYQACREECEHSLKDSYGDPDPGVEEEDPNLEPVEPVQESSFDELAGRRPGSGGELVDEDRIGDRPSDRVKDWTAVQHVDSYGLDMRTYWPNAKRDYPVGVTNTQANTWSNTQANTLQEKQRILYDLVVNHFQASLDGQSPPQLLVQLDGQGGTGKTYLIECLSRSLEHTASQAGLQSPVMRCAPTGVAAFLISGYTINALFRIPVMSTYAQLDPLNATGRQHIQAVFKHIRYLIIDEKSMVSLHMLTSIHNRCGQIWPSQAHLPFAGLNVILSGDYYQLPPVGRRALFDHSSRKDPFEVHGQHLYRAFKKTVVLDTVLRQQGEAQARFRDALQRLRTGGSTQNDWAMFMTRCRANLPYSDYASFRDAIRLCGRRAEVSHINHESIRDCGSPVLVVLAQHDQAAWASASTDEASNLPNQLPLCIGARVMITTNVWTERGLVNGTTGIVDNILWDSSVTNPRETMPKAVLLALQDYSGPSLYTRADGQAVVPIFPVLRDFYWNKMCCSRLQFPLSLAWAITIHKSQGMSLRRALIRCDRDFVPGLLYVAVSRVTSLEGLMFDEPMSFDRLHGRDGKVAQMRKKDEERRARELVSLS